MSRRRTARTRETTATNQAAIDTSTALDDDRPDTVDRLCPGPCNRPYLRAAQRAAAEIQLAHDDGDRDWNLHLIDHDVRPHAAAPVWCRTCQHRLTTTLGRLPQLAADLFDRTAGERPDAGRVIVAHGWTLAGRLEWLLDCGHVVTAHRIPTSDLVLCVECLGSSTVGVGRLAASAQTDRTETRKRIVSPSGSPAWDAVDELVSWAGRLEEDLRAHLHHAPSPRSYRAGSAEARARALSGAVTYLTEWAAALWAAPFAEAVGHQLQHLQRRAEHAAGLDELVHRLPAPCPSCDRKALTRDDGSDTVACGGCGRVWTEPEYRRLTLILAGEARGHVPPPRQRRRLVHASHGYGGRA